jgi:hypothetical protein
MRLAALALSAVLLGMAPPPPLSIQPLQHDGITFCTAFSINAQEHFWATAKHCARAAHEYQWEMTIAGSWAAVFYVPPDPDDVVVLVAGVGAPAVRLAKTAPTVGDAVEIRGYPYGLGKLVTVRGIVAARMIPIPDRPFSDILDITVAGGNSGSPVLKDGKVVGVLWGRFLHSEHALSMPWESIQRAIGVYFG